MHNSFYFSGLQMYSANTTKKRPVVALTTVFHFFHVYTLGDILLHHLGKYTLNQWLKQGMLHVWPHPYQ